MTCTYCGTELPAGALFCGECGRAVAPATKRVERVEVPAALPALRPESTTSADDGAADDANSGWLENENEVGNASGIGNVSDVVYCEQCGATMGAEDIFCGECGAVSHAAAQHFSQPRDTVVIEPIAAERELDDLVVAEHPVVAEPVEEPEPVEQPEPIEQPEPVTEPESVAGPQQGVVPAPEPVDSTPQPAVRGQAPFADFDDVEATRIVGRERVGERFVLQFSTGESFTVHGTGLIGRNPIPEPGEYVDELVRVIDPSRSVSKTHLEFGQESGAFWIMDRYSGNGTIVREPDAQVIRCQPERRYRVARGTRIEIGEQFFIVS